MFQPEPQLQPLNPFSKRPWRRKYFLREERVPRIQVLRHGSRYLAAQARILIGTYDPRVVTVPHAIIDGASPLQDCKENKKESALRLVLLLLFPLLRPLPGHLERCSCRIGDRF